MKEFDISSKPIDIGGTQFYVDTEMTTSTINQCGNSNTSNNSYNTTTNSCYYPPPPHGTIAGHGHHSLHHHHEHPSPLDTYCWGSLSALSPTMLYHDTSSSNYPNTIADLNCIVSDSNSQQQKKQRFTKQQIITTHPHPKSFTTRQTIKTSSPQSTTSSVCGRNFNQKTKKQQQQQQQQLQQHQHQHQHQHQLQHQLQHQHLHQHQLQHEYQHQMSSMNAYILHNHDNNCGVSGSGLDSSGNSSIRDSNSGSNCSEHSNNGDIFSHFMRGRIESLKRRYCVDYVTEEMVIHLLSFLVSRSSSQTGFTESFTCYTVHNTLLEVFEVLLPEYNLPVTSRIYNPAVAALERISSLDGSFLNIKTFKVFEQAYNRIKNIPNAHADSAYMRILFLFNDLIPKFSLGPNYQETGSQLAMKFLLDRDKRYKKGSHNRKFFYLLCQAVLDHRC